MSNLIPFTYLTEQAFLSENIDSRKLQIPLDMAQDNLKNILGKTFYDEIVTQYTADALTEDNEELYDYIKKYLAWETAFYFTKFSQSDSTPTGFRSFDDENSTLIQDIQLTSLSKNQKERSVFYKNSMINFLNQQKDLDKFPLWNKKCDSNFSFGITAIDKRSNTMLKVNKSTITNE